MHNIPTCNSWTERREYYMVQSLRQKILYLSTEETISAGSLLVDGHYRADK